ncbi:MAG: hypothetical protein LAO76_03915 [Acidobacteriia bacterium]|nr:hypothetical protein [Terriglobia bacterium]
MDDNQKWLEAAAAIEKDITYLKAAMADAERNGIPLGLDQEILQLNVVLGIYRTNSANGVAFPHPDNLFCISDLPYDAAETTETPRGLKASAF